MWRQHDQPEETCAELGSVISGMLDPLKYGGEVIDDCIKDLEKVASDLLARGDEAYEPGARYKDDLMRLMADAIYAISDAEVAMKAIHQAFDSRG